MFYDGGYAMGGMHGLWWLFWLALIGVLVFYGWGSPSAKRQRPHETPLDVLQRRLASGEIAPEQYEQRKALLESDGK
ncbi:MAG: SHOCT domain-containing protein, partial [Caldimonas sp.]